MTFRAGDVMKTEKTLTEKKRKEKTPLDFKMLLGGVWEGGDLFMCKALRSFEFSFFVFEKEIITVR